MTVSKGVVLFAHNTDTIDYYAMASYTAGRIYKFLNLPVTVITDNNSITTDFSFDRIIKVDPDYSNKRKKSVWINKGRFEVFDLTPYEETILLDTDYMINGDQLLKTFDYYSDFVCYHDSKYFLKNNLNEQLSKKSFPTLWATVIRFRKTERVEQVFEMINMIQNNYQHYSEVHGFLPHMYRNDYALTIALRTVNGQFECAEDMIPGQLLHVDINVKIERIDDTTYKIYTYDSEKIKKYIIIKDIDFHMLNKYDFMGLR